MYLFILMENHIVFFIYLYLILISIIGYGYFISKNIFYKNELIFLNFSSVCFSGFIFVTTISFITSFFFRHGYSHNFLLYFFGIILFFYEKKNYQNKHFKNILILSLFYLIGLFIYKTHDDFSYYHLSYTRFLYDHDIYLGMGALNHGFRTFSSLFFFNSTTIFPKLNFYSFHFSIFYLFLFTSYFFLEKIKFYLKNEKSIFLASLSVLAFLYSTNVFYRFGEYGVDRSAQSILLIIIFLFFELNFYKKNNSNYYLNINSANLKFLILVTSFVATLKVLFVIYGLFLIAFFKDILKLDFLKKNFKAILFSAILFFLTLLINFFNTGCLLYPENKTCFSKLAWSIPKEEVKQMKIHYEWWSKAGGGPDYSSKTKKEEYVKNFNWIKDWINRHFFNKVLDNIASTFFICIIYLLSIFSLRKKKIKNNFNFKFFSIIYLLILLEWFLNHPSMRYGGFILVALPMIVLTAFYSSTNQYNSDILKKRIKFLIVLSILTFNFQNLKRIEKEKKQYKFNYSSLPFFYLPKVKYKTHQLNHDTQSFQPINNSCWAVPTPCGGKYKIIKKYGKKIILREKK